LSSGPVSPRRSSSHRQAVLHELFADLPVPVAYLAGRDLVFEFANDAYRQDVHSEVGEVVDGIRASARNDLAVAMLQDEHGRFARDARNLAEHELVGYQIRKNRNGELGKRFDDLL